ncbi:hypothetical protein [Microbacterium sp.]|uniref:hypothetical protein n=1 Tax=Microbacterium sp. TaxID=51671 RepID=UPI002810F510|nr:hypothetical protein [Microbacterium sp.]
MSIRDPRGQTPSGVSAPLALVIGVVCFLALAILGLGMLSYFANVDIISVEGIGLWPGILGMAVAIAVLAGMLWSQVRRGHPAFPPVLLTALLTALTHLAAVWVFAAGAAGIVHASAAVSQLVVRGSSVVVLLAAAVAAWIAVALRRTRARPPHWPWESENDE